MWTSDLLSNSGNEKELTALVMRDIDAGKGEVQYAGLSSQVWNAHLPNLPVVKFTLSLVSNGFYKYPPHTHTLYVRHEKLECSVYHDFASPMVTRYNVLQVTQVKNWLIDILIQNLFSLPLKVS